MVAWLVRFCSNRPTSDKSKSSEAGFPPSIGTTLTEILAWKLLTSTESSFQSSAARTLEITSASVWS